MANGKAMAVLAVGLFVVVWAQAFDARDGEQKKKKVAPVPVKEADKKTHKVEKKPFKIELKMKGTLEGQERFEIAYRTSPISGLSYSPGQLTIRKVVDQGTTVKKGDFLIAFDSRKIEQTISQGESELKILEAALALAEEEQPHVEKSLPVDIEAAVRSKNQADEDLTYFLKVGRPESEKRADTHVKMVAFFLEHAQEQLQQLEKMYKSHDLTEGTEQIILKRQRFMVEEAANELRLAQMEREYLVKTVLPRREILFRDNAFRQTMALEKTRTGLPLQVGHKRTILAKMRTDRERLTQGLAMLRQERDAMTLTAPADGVVYFGKFRTGQWENAATLAGKLVPGGSVPPDDVLMTVVRCRPLLIRLQVEEKDLYLLRAGLVGQARLVSNPEVKFPARVFGVGGVPTSPGKFEALLVLDTGANTFAMPGMTCTVQMVPFDKVQAIVVPTSAIIEEDQKHFVDVVKDGKVQRRAVTPGQVHEENTEILNGLTEGEEILLDRSTAGTQGGKAQ